VFDVSKTVVDCDYWITRYNRIVIK